MIVRTAVLLLLVVALSALLRGERLGVSAAFELGPFSAYLVALILSALLFSRGRAERVGWFAAFVLAASTRNLVLIASGMVIVPMLVAGRRRAWLVVWLASSLALLPGYDLSRAGAASDVAIGLFLLGLIAAWFVTYRYLFARDAYDPAESVPLAFAGLVALVSAGMRLDAWLPEHRVVEWTFAGTGAVFLLLGSMGVFFAADRRNLVRWGLLAQAGLTLLLLLGGVEARAFVLAHLVVVGLAVHVLAVARDRLVLVVGALALFAPPPFPGFAFVMGAASAVLSEGHGALLLAMLPVYALAGAGAIRYAFEPDDGLESVVSPVGALTALVAMVLLGIWPGPLVAVVRLAAAGLF